MKKKIILGYLVVIFSILVIGLVAKKFIIIEWKYQLFTVVSGIGIGMILAYFFSNSLTRDIKKLVEASKVVSKGDLVEDVHIQSKDEIGELVNAFNHMIGNLRNLVGKMKYSSKQVSESAGDFSNLAQEMKATILEISASIESISTGAEKQSLLVDNASEIMGKMAEGTGAINQKVQATTQKAEDMGLRAREAGNASDSASTEMEEAFSKIDSSINLVKQFVKKVTEINKISNLIKEVSQQTNMLALNATIEASRAGEFGAGFVVVADEVRKLADTTRELSDKIQSIIEDIQEEHHLIVTSFGSATSGINEGRQILKKISTALKTIANGVIGMVSEIRGISSVTGVQAKEVEKMVSAIDELAKLAESNAAATEETAAATEEQAASMDGLASLATDLTNLSKELKKAASQFIVRGESLAAEEQAEEVINLQTEEMRLSLNGLESTGPKDDEFGELDDIEFKS